MWSLVSNILTTLLFIAELVKVASSNQKAETVDIIDNFIGLAEPLSQSELEKRNSIVDGGVFVPYKSTTIVYKSRLVPVTYGFVIKKETLKENPSLYKLGVKLLDEKVEPTPKQLLDEKKVESAAKPLLEAKSNCVEGSKVLKLLAKLSKDINNIEKAIRAENQTIKSKRVKLIAKSQQKKEEEYNNPHPEHEAHESGHKGVFEKELNKNSKSQNHAISKNLSKYWQCRRSHTRKKCAVLFLMKHAGAKHHHSKHKAKHTTHHKKHYRKKPHGFKNNERQREDRDRAKHSFRLTNKKKILKKRQRCKNCKVKLRHGKSKHRQSNLRLTTRHRIRI